jgi:hypothetical protein
MDRHLGNLTIEQQARLDKIRNEIQDAGYNDRTDDATLVWTSMWWFWCKLRFLRARKWDVHAAYTMFTDCENWRKEYGVDELVHSFQFTEREQVNKYYPQYYHKTDKVMSPRLRLTTVGSTIVFRTVGHHRHPSHVQNHNPKTSPPKSRRRKWEIRKYQTSKSLHGF